MFPEISTPTASVDFVTTYERERNLSPLTTFIGAINLYDQDDWTPCFIQYKAAVVLIHLLLKNHRPESTILTFDYRGQARY